MTRTSKVLKRLGVAAVAAATIGAGVPALIATGAQAAATDPSSITVTPTTQSAGTGTCQVFTVNIKDSLGNAATGTVSVQLTDPSPATPTTGTVNPSQGSATFCTVSGANEPVPTAASSSSAPNKRTLTQSTTTGKVTFGVNDTEVENVPLFAYIDNGTIGTFDPTTDFAAAQQPSAAFTAGGDNNTGAFSQQANDNVSTITDQSKAADVSITVLVKNAAGDVVTGARPSFQYQAGSVNGGATATAAGSTGTCSASDNSGLSVCALTPTKGGTDKILVWVNQSPPNGLTPNADPKEPQITITRVSAAPAADATNVTLTPTGQTFAAGTSIRYTAAVTDKNGSPVQGIDVTFTASGAGGTQGPFTTGPTDNTGKTSAIFQTASNDSGAQTVKATISTGSTACSVATPPAGCSATATNTIGAASPSPSTSPTATSSPTAGGKGTLSTSTPDIQPNIQGVLNASGLTANAAYELRCYSRPSTTYFTARTATTSAGSSTLEFRILPGSNTRCYVRPAGNEAAASNSVVINVHTTLSLSTVRTGVRTYIFQGRNLPRRAGQLITLYRVDSAGNEIRTTNLTTDASGIYRVTRTFTGTGTFQFKVRTSQTLNNAAGVSNVITVNVH